MHTKYIRHSAIGFVLWDSKVMVTHEQMAKAMPKHMGGNLLSAGFVVFVQGRPHCMGGSTSLDLQGAADDNAVLAKQLGIVPVLQVQP